MFSIFQKTVMSVLLLSFLGCGYTTRGFIDPRFKTVYVRPVVNDIKITGETQENDKFRSVPPLLENNLTSALLDRFNLDGSLKVVDESSADLIVEAALIDYYRESVRYDDDEEIEEQRIKLIFTFESFDSEGELIKSKKLVAHEDYATSGSNARTEEVAIDELMDDAARRLVEEIIEAW